jgi:hypothetical protein
VTISPALKNLAVEIRQAHEAEEQELQAMRMEGEQERLAAEEHCIPDLLPNKRANPSYQTTTAGL